MTEVDIAEVIKLIEEPCPKHGCRREPQFGWTGGPLWVCPKCMAKEPACVVSLQNRNDTPSADAT